MCVRVRTCPHDPVSHWAHGWLLHDWMLLGWRSSSHRSSSGQVTIRCCSPPPHTSEHWTTHNHSIYAFGCIQPWLSGLLSMEDSMHVQIEWLKVHLLDSSNTGEKLQCFYKWISIKLWNEQKANSYQEDWKKCFQRSINIPCTVWYAFKDDCSYIDECSNIKNMNMEMPLFLFSFLLLIQC